MTEQLDIFSVSGVNSPQPSSNSTGQEPNTGATLPTLLPTPEAQNHSGFQNRHGRKYPRVGSVISQLSQEDSLASHSARPDEEKARAMTATSGRKCLPSLKTPDPTGSLLKTFAGLLLGTTAWYSSRCALTWKPKVTKSNRLLFQLSPSMHPTSGIESGLLQTPSTVDRVRSEEALQKRIAFRKSIGRNTVPPGNLSEQIATGYLTNVLPTPDHNDGARGPTKVYDPKAKSQSGRTINTLIGSGLGRKLRLQPAMTQWMMGYPDLWTEFPLAELSGDLIHSKPTATE